MDSLNTKKRVRVNSNSSESNSVSPKRVQLDHLDFLEDSEFIKTFETEISKLPTTDSVSGDIGFLFEASDDELGLPPTELTQTESVGLGDDLVDDWGFDEQICGYELFEYGFGYSDGGECDDEYVKLDGLFGSPEISLQPETMPAK